MLYTNFRGRSQTKKKKRGGEALNCKVRFSWGGLEHGENLITKKPVLSSIL